MNPQVKAKWIDALRSGEYSQTDGALQDEHGFCCLGVLCDLYSKSHGMSWKVLDLTEVPHQNHNRFYFENESEFLPQSVREWADLSGCNPTIIEYDEEDNSETEYEISTLNDSGYTFDRIANIIEDQF